MLSGFLPLPFPPSMPIPGIRLAAALLLGLAVAAPCPAQAACTDPPTDGQVVVHRNQAVLFSDGYQTLMDVYLPAVAPGSCGWPTILWVHSNRGHKGAVESLARHAASRGYAALSFDFRGQGPSMQLNDPMQYGRGELGLRERLDLFELLEAAEALFPTAIDFTRLAVTGPTQGGYSAWAAAAHSGKAPPANPWRTAAFPSISAVVAHDFSADLWEWLLPEGEAMTEMFAFNLFENHPGLHNDPAFVAAARPFVLAEDFAGLRSRMDRPELHLPTLLQSSAVPILASLSYDDKFGPPNSLLEAWSSMAPGAPKLLNLTTGGHATPFNRAEDERRRRRQDLWFDRFLKGHPNGVELEPEVRMAIVPSSVEEHRATDSLWDAMEFPAWPPAPAQRERWYLNAGGVLRRSSPITSYGEDRLASLNPGAYTIDDYVAELPSPEALQHSLPLSEVHFDTDPMTRDRLLLGNSVVRLYAESPDSAFQLHAALFDLDPAGGSRYITGGSTTRRQHSGGAVLLEFPLSAYGYTLRAGHRLRLQVENLAWHRPPMTSRNQPPEALPTFLTAVPVFEPYTVDLQRTTTGPSHLELATVAADQPRLVCDAAWFDLSEPREVSLGLYSDSDHDGRQFQILMSLSGTSPPTPFLGLMVPLVFDPLTAACLQAPESPAWTGLRGRLDPDGRAGARLFGHKLPPLPPFVGTLDLVAVVEDANGQPELSRGLRLLVE